MVYFVANILHKVSDGKPLEIKFQFSALMPILFEMN